jgi:hypothetical protein
VLSKLDEVSSPGPHHRVRLLLAILLASPPPPHQTAPRGEPPVLVEYEIARVDAGHAVLLGGESELGLGHGATVESKPAHGVAAVLRLGAERGDGGRMLVNVDWEERSDDGRTIHWRPTLSLSPDKVGAAKLDLGGGDGRVLTLRVRAPGAAKAGAQVASASSP